MPGHLWTSSVLGSFPPAMEGDPCPSSSNCVAVFSCPCGTWTWDLGLPPGTRPDSSSLCREWGLPEAWACTSSLPVYLGICGVVGPLSAWARTVVRVSPAAPWLLVPSPACLDVAVWPSPAVLPQSCGAGPVRQGLVRELHPQLGDTEEPGVASCQALQPPGLQHVQAPWFPVPSAV